MGNCNEIIQNMIIMMIISVILLFVCECFSLPIAAALNAKDAMMPELASYIRGFAIGLNILTIIV